MARHPGSQQYPFQPGDRIRVSNRSSVTTANKVFVRVRYEDGEKDRFEIPITHAGDRANEVSFSPDTFLRDGFVEALTVDTEIVARGECYLAIQVDNENESLHYQIFAGYVTPLHTPLGFFEHSLSGVGLKVDNEAASTLVNNTTFTRTITVPTGARWEFKYGRALQADNVTRSITVTLDDGAQDLLRMIQSAVPAGAVTQFTSNEATDNMVGAIDSVPMSAGDRVLIVWTAGGASAGGTARSSFVVEELIAP